ncbi:MAG: hypothetical protein IT337_14095 [Thermomicrobiales bacterium]|nr:hypothetical protein [Thermomicrobiales bacterium]
MRFARGIVADRRDLDRGGCLPHPQSQSLSAPPADTGVAAPARAWTDDLRGAANPSTLDEMLAPDVSYIAPPTSRPCSVPGA